MTKHILALALAILVIFTGCKPRPEKKEKEVSLQFEHIDIQPLSTDLSSSIYIEEAPPPRYGFTDEDIYLLAQLLCGDESYDGDGEYDFVWGVLHDEMNYYEMSKVLCVVMNRVRSDIFPDTVHDVVLQRGQFVGYERTDTKPADIAIEKVREWCEAYDRWDPGVQSIDEDHLYFEAGPNLTNITRANW